MNHPLFYPSPSANTSSLIWLSTLYFALYINLIFALIALDYPRVGLNGSHPLKILDLSYEEVPIILVMLQMVFSYQHQWRLLNSFRASCTIWKSLECTHCLKTELWQIMKMIEFPTRAFSSHYTKTSMSNTNVAITLFPLNPTKPWTKVSQFEASK